MNEKTAKLLNRAASAKFREVLADVNSKRKEPLTSEQETRVYNHVRSSVYRMWRDANKTRRRGLRRGLAHEVSRLAV